MVSIETFVAVDIRLIQPAPLQCRPSGWNAEKLDPRQGRDEAAAADRTRMNHCAHCPVSRSTDSWPKRTLLSERTSTIRPMRNPTYIAIASVAVLTAACGGTPEAAKTSTSTVTNTVTVAAPQATSGPAPEVVSATWTMPNLIGTNLQHAQNEIQRITNNEVFFSSSTDLTGDARAQIVDRNWQVCTSTPAPGESFTAETSIDFGVVRIDVESCP